MTCPSAAWPRSLSLVGRSRAWRTGLAMGGGGLGRHLQLEFLKAAADCRPYHTWEARPGDPPEAPAADERLDECVCVCVCAPVQSDVREVL